MQQFAKELVALQPDVIFSQSTPSTAALLQQTRTIPIVFAVVLDPVGSGFVASFPRPGGNVTGLTNFETTVAGKWLAMLKEIAPRVTRAALVINPKTSSFAHYLREAEAMARSLAIDLTPNPIENAADIERHRVKWPNPHFSNN
jgi:putative ABC transport system substrate-binding protein